MELKKALKNARRGKGWTQDQLAAASGVSQPTISQLEKGETVPKWPTVRALAIALEMSLDEVLFDDSEEEQAA